MRPNKVLINNSSVTTIHSSELASTVSKLLVVPVKGVQFAIIRESAYQKLLSEDRNGDRFQHIIRASQILNSPFHDKKSIRFTVTHSSEEIADWLLPIIELKASEDGLNYICNNRYQIGDIRSNIIHVLNSAAEDRGLGFIAVEDAHQYFSLLAIKKMYVSPRISEETKIALSKNLSCAIKDVGKEYDPDEQFILNERLMLIREIFQNILNVRQGLRITELVDLEECAKKGESVLLVVNDKNKAPDFVYSCLSMINQFISIREIDLVVDQNDKYLLSMLDNFHIRSL